MSSKNVTMKVLLVSFFNDEAYGMRVIHSNLVNNDNDIYELINDYKNSKDIRAIKNVVEPYLRVRTH